MANTLNNWNGRTDGTSSSQLRWHQIAAPANFNQTFKQQFVITGFCSDQGVQRNKGRIGAKEAPNVLRKIMSNFPAHHLKIIIDAGNIVCENNNLETAQQQLTQKVEEILKNNGKSIVLGGGHTLTYPHYKALKNTFPNQKIGIINFDAHFDNRPIDSSIGATSGTGFYQIAEEGPIHSLHLGIAENSNTQALFNYAHKKNMQYILAKDFNPNNNQLKATIEGFISTIDKLYLTVCLDVFSSAFAPGVSATAYNGIIPNYFFHQIFNQIISHPKLKAFDVAELNPQLDIDHRTAKLAANLIYQVMHN